MYTCRLMRQSPSRTTIKTMLTPTYHTGYVYTVENVYYRRSTPVHYIGEYLCRYDNVILISSSMLLVPSSTGIYSTRDTASCRPGIRVAVTLTLVQYGISC